MMFFLTKYDTQQEFHRNCTQTSARYSAAAFPDVYLKVFPHPFFLISSKHLWTSIYLNHSQHSMALATHGCYPRAHQLQVSARDSDNNGPGAGRTQANLHLETPADTARCLLIVFVTKANCILLMSSVRGR